MSSERGGIVLRLKFEIIKTWLGVGAISKYEGIEAVRVAWSVGKALGLYKNG